MNMVFNFNVSQEDKKILNEGKADFFAFSYYMSSCATTHQDKTELTNGNLSLGAKNPYLDATEWGWQIDPTGLKFYLA